MEAEEREKEKKKFRTEEGKTTKRMKKSRKRK